MLLLDSLKIKKKIYEDLHFISAEPKELYILLQNSHKLFCCPSEVISDGETKKWKTFSRNLDIKTHTHME